jgi:hypothetical protein
MKRSLLLVAVTLLALSFPTGASACQWICESAFGPCIYEVNTYSVCIDTGGACWMDACWKRSAANPELLSTKWKIASIEIERNGPAGKRESEIRVASSTKTEHVKTELPSLE